MLHSALSVLQVRGAVEDTITRFDEGLLGLADRRARIASDCAALESRIIGLAAAADV